MTFSKLSVFTSLIFTILNLFQFFSLISAQSTSVISACASLNTQLVGPFGLWKDTLGNLYTSDDNQARIYKMDTSNIVTLYAGSIVGFGGDGGPATSAKFLCPRQMWSDDVNFYVAEECNLRVRRITIATGIITTYAGGGSTSPTLSSGNSLLATNALLDNKLSGLWGDGSGNLFVGSEKYIYKINAGGYISIFAGNPSGSLTSNAATNVNLNSNYFITGDRNGNLYTSDFQHRVVRKINIATGYTSVIVGQMNQQASPLGNTDPWVEGAQATSIRLSAALGLWIGPDGTLYVGDSGASIVFGVLSDGSVKLIAGQKWVTGGSGRDNTATLFGNGGPATSGTMASVYGVVGDSLGNLYIADLYHSSVRVVNHLPVSAAPTIAPSQPPTHSPTIAHQLCTSTGYCNGDTVALRGDYTDPALCAAACIQNDSSFKYFDITNNHQCWCGTSCESLIDFETSSYSMNDGYCPTQAPSEAPSFAPSFSLSPTVTPTDLPTVRPSQVPTVAPSPVPTWNPTITPSQTPTDQPTVVPTSEPSVAPSFSPTTATPTEVPTSAPSDSPTELPSNSPTESPSVIPTVTPSSAPTFAPSEIYSVCLTSGYCSGDTYALRGIFTSPDLCHAACSAVNEDFKYFDLTASQQCWCGFSCDNVVTFETQGYRMGGGVCPVSRRNLRG